MLRECPNAVNRTSPDDEKASPRSRSRIRRLRRRRRHGGHVRGHRRGAQRSEDGDRAGPPVFGGNASSEIRMWICGAHGAHNKETGILEEIQLENQYHNPVGQLLDLGQRAVGQDRLSAQPDRFLNCSCTDAEMDGEPHRRDQGMAA